MRTAQRISRASGLCLVLSGLMGSPPERRSSLLRTRLVHLRCRPDGFNGKVAGFGARQQPALYAEPVRSQFRSVPLWLADRCIGGRVRQPVSGVTVAGTARICSGAIPRAAYRALRHYLHADAFSASMSMPAPSRQRSTLDALHWRPWLVRRAGNSISARLAASTSTRASSIGAARLLSDRQSEALHRPQLRLWQQQRTDCAEWGLPTGGGTMASLFVRGSV